MKSGFPFSSIMNYYVAHFFRICEFALLGNHNGENVCFASYFTLYAIPLPPHWIKGVITSNSLFFSLDEAYAYLSVYSSGHSAELVKQKREKACCA